MKIKGGILSPVLHDGSTQDLVYGVDEAGRYLGLTQAANAPQTADSAPPRHGEWRWKDGAWSKWVPLDQQIALIEAERDRRIGEGFELGGRRYYADETFSAQVTAMLSCFSNGILPEDATVDIRCMDKVVYPVSREELITIGAALLQFVQGVWAWSWTEKASIQG